MDATTMSYRDRGALAVEILTGYLRHQHDGPEGARHLWTSGDEARVEHLVAALLGTETEALSVEPAARFIPMVAGGAVRIDIVARFWPAERQDGVGWVIPVVDASGDEGRLGPWASLDDAQRWADRHLPLADLLVDVEVVE